MCHAIVFSGLTSLDFSITILDGLDEIISSDGSTALVISAAAVRLSEIWPDFPSSEKHINFFIRSITGFLQNVAKAQNILQENSTNVGLSALSLNCLNVISNAANFLGKIRSSEASAAQLRLLRLRQNFLETLSKVHDMDEREQCTRIDNECIAISNVNETVEPGVNGTNGTSFSDEESDFVAVSTFKFNPFPEMENITDLLDENSDQEFLDINTPVIGISDVSRNKTERPDVAPTFDVTIPLGENVSASGDVVFLPPLCTPHVPIEVGSYVKVDRLNKLCGPASMKFDTLSIRRASFDPTDTDLQKSVDVAIGFMILKLATKCVLVNEPCIKVHFVKARRTFGCLSSNDSCVSGYDVFHSVTLPEPVNATLSFKEDPFSISLSERLLADISSADESAVVLLEDIQPDPLTDVRYGSNKFRKVRIKLVSELVFSLFNTCTVKIYGFYFFDIYGISVIRIV